MITPSVHEPTRAHCATSPDDFSNPNKRTKSQYRLIFTYGTLKSGEPNNWILNQREKNICGTVLAKARTIRKYPLVVATTYKVPFLVDAEGYGHFVEGEVVAVDDDTLRFLDVFEGHPELYFRRTEKVEITEVIIPNVHSVHGVKSDPNLRKLSLSPDATTSSRRNGANEKGNTPAKKTLSTNNYLCVPGAPQQNNQKLPVDRRSSLIPSSANESLSIIERLLTIPTTPSIGRGGFHYTAPRVYHDLHFEHLKIKPGDVIECEAYFLQHYKHFFAKQKVTVACYTSSNKVLGKFNASPTKKPKVKSTMPRTVSVCESDSDIDDDEDSETMEREELQLDAMMRKIIVQPWEEKFECANMNSGIA